MTWNWNQTFLASTMTKSLCVVRKTLFPQDRVINLILYNHRLTDPRDTVPSQRALEWLFSNGEKSRFGFVHSRHQCTVTCRLMMGIHPLGKVSPGDFSIVWISQGTLWHHQGWQSLMESAVCSVPLWSKHCHGMHGFIWICVCINVRKPTIQPKNAAQHLVPSQWCNSSWLSKRSWKVASSSNIRWKLLGPPSTPQVTVGVAVILETLMLTYHIWAHSMKDYHSLGSKWTTLSLPKEAEQRAAVGCCQPMPMAQTSERSREKQWLSELINTGIIVFLFSRDQFLCVALAVRELTL